MSILSLYFFRNSIISHIKYAIFSSYYINTYIVNNLLQTFIFNIFMQIYEKIATVAIIYSIFVRFSFRLLLIACFVGAICGCIVDSERTSLAQCLLNIADKSHVGLAICKNTDHHVLAVL